MIFDSVTVYDLVPFIAVGFAAQLVDGALGMAFGVISSTLLLSLGVPPAAASAGVHTVESFTTGVSGLSHIAHRNVEWRLLARLAIPGVIGGCLGAYVLTNIDAGTSTPFVLAYLATIGIYLIWRSTRRQLEHRQARVVEPLGLAGGFLDAVGGGGWGPVVTSNLLVQGHEPRMTIGTVSASEFVLSVTISITFIMALGIEAFTVSTVGLLIGGVLAAPLGAFIVKKVHASRLLLLVGALLTITSLCGAYNALT